MIYTGTIAARGRLLNDDIPVHISAINCTGVETTLYGCSLTFTLEDLQSCAVDQGVACQGEAYVLYLNMFVYEWRTAVCVTFTVHNEL